MRKETGGRRHSIKVIADVMSLFLIVVCCIGIIHVVVIVK